MSGNDDQPAFTSSSTTGGLAATWDPPALDLNERALDLDELVERCLGSLDFAERILQKYQERFPAEVDELQRIGLQEDAEQVARIAHRMKGAAANVAAHSLRDVFAEIERIGRQQQLSELPRSLCRLQDEWDRFVTTASDLLNQAQSC